MTAGSDGSIWIGTMDGLNEWNGHSIRVFRSPQLPNSFINAVSISDSLVFTGTSRGLAVLASKSFNLVPQDHWKVLIHEIGDHQVFAIQIHQDSVWISGSFDGFLVACLRTGSFRKISFSQSIIRFFISERAIAGTSSSGDSYWIHADTGELLGSYPGVVFTCFQPLKSKLLLAGTHGHGVFLLNTENLLSDKVLWNANNDPILSIVKRENNSTIYFSAAKTGIYLSSDSTFKSVNLVLNEPNTSTLLTTRHELLAGTSGKGILRLQERSLPVQVFTVRDGLSHPHVWFMSSVDSLTMLAATQSGITEIQTVTGSMKRYYPYGNDPYAAGNNILRVRKVGPDFILITRNHDIFTFNPNFKQTRFLGRGFDLIPVSDTQLLILNQDGLLTSLNGAVYPDQPDAPISLMKKVRRIKKIGNDLYAMMTVNHGLAIWNIRNKHCFFGNTDSSDFPIADNRVYDALLDQEGTIWVATNSGLTRWNPDTGQTTHYKTNHGLPSDLIYSLVADNEYHLWSGTGNGLVRITTGPDITEFLNYKPDGLLIPDDFMAGAAVLDSHGLIWMEGSHGLIRFDPSAMPVPEISNSFLLNMSGTNRVQTIGEHNQPFVIQSGQSIHGWWKGPILPEIWTFQPTIRVYDGEKTWFESSGTSFQIVGLPPGTYQVEGVISTGGSNRFRQGLNTSIIVKPRVWETIWFYLFLTFFTTGLLLAIFSWSSRRRTTMLLLRQKIQLEEQENLRRQVAQDFHDELGHQLSKMALQSQIIAGKLEHESVPDDVRSLTKKINDQSVSLYANLRDLIWSLHPGKDSISDLILRIKDSGDDLFYLSGIQFMMSGFSELAGNQILTPEQKRHVLLIAKEAMTNCLRHSSATLFNITASTSDSAFTLIFADNGKGFNQHNQTGTGLLSIHTRVRRLNGNLAITSGPQGTSLEIQIPVPTHSGSYLSGQ